MNARELCGCEHMLGIHLGPAGRCRINGCPCDEFNKPGQAPEDPEGEVVTIRVPPGYVLNVQLVPLAEPAEEGAA